MRVSSPHLDALGREHTWSLPARSHDLVRKPGRGMAWSSSQRSWQGQDRDMMDGRKKRKVETQCLCVEGGEQIEGRDLHPANTSAQGWQGSACRGQGVTVNVTDVPTFPPEHV